MGCGDKKLLKYLTQTFMAHCNARICQQVPLSDDAEWPKVADAVIEAHFQACPHPRGGLWASLPTVFSRAWLAWCYAELGSFAAGRACGDEGLRIAEAAAHPVSLMFAWWGIGLLS